MTAPARPPSTVPHLQPDNIPAELRERPQWVTWCYEPRDEGWTKVPYQAATGAGASSTAPATWSTFDAVLAAARQEGSDLDGIGYVFSANDPYCGIDLDGCLAEDGALAPRATEIIQMLDGYTEISPSRRGVKVWVRAKLPGSGSGRRTAKVDGFAGIEMYQHSRFFTVTGWRLP